ncbi:MAG: gliding motility-associated ABC transporter substrate-binding protein GldG, partial [Bacteroidales bacterium]|nr:gliding motility-associated ABC transporter substrate-binding protein GldG [Bacteroidales bacterium]
NSLNDDIYIQVFLDGEMPVGFKRLHHSVTAMLEEFRILWGRKVDFMFINPSGSEDKEERVNYQRSLINKGLYPVEIFDEDKEGGQSTKIIFPGLIVNYNGIEMPVNFLKNNPSLSAEQNLLNSVEGLEYELIQSISTICADTIYKIAFLEGHGELDEIEVADLTLELGKFFTIDRGVIGGQPGILDDYAALVIAKPSVRFSEDDKLIIDQYIMNGGKTIWLIDAVYLNNDSLAMGGSMALYNPLNIEDQLFKYGIRINPVLIQDTDCITLPLSTSFGNQRQQPLPVPWIYSPLLYPSIKSPITRNINKVKGDFVNYLDTVGEDSGITKRILLATSPNSRFVSPPRIVSLDEFRNPPPEEMFNSQFLPVAVLLKGEFPSLYSNRVRDYNGSRLKEKSDFNKMIVIADGDIIRNDITREQGSLIPLPLGYDRYRKLTYGNKDFLVNCLNWLVDDKGIMELRSRELKIRRLDMERVASARLLWQLLNTLGPIILVLLFATLYRLVRMRKHATNLSHEPNMTIENKL